MKIILSYRGIQITATKLATIKVIISNNPLDCRSELSRKICKEFNWIQSNGYLRDMVCRGLLVQLENNGHLCLPARRNLPPQFRKAKEKTVTDGLTIDTTPLSSRVKDLKPLSIDQVRRSKSEKLYRHLIQQYHYLGYSQPVGEHLKYVVYYEQRPIACMAFSSAPRHIGSRDRFIGWDQVTRRKNIHFIAYNTRFLIVPWVSIPHLASHLLGSIARRINDDWLALYNHPLYFLETFVDTERFAGTCYKAANWIYMGLTTGRGKNDHTYKPNRSIKAVWGYPLTKKFRENLLQCA